MINQFSIELGLTQQQKQQIVPILKQAAPQLETLKKNTSLKPLQKIEQLKQIADSVDSKITPLLNPDQQQKFQAIRDEHRRELIEKMASQVVEKVGTDLKKVETDAEKASGRHHAEGGKPTSGRRCRAWIRKKIHWVAFGQCSFLSLVRDCW